ncbi:ketopantoate reductase PanE/ApbA C terminal-domain-containing protein [Dendryphion nanum]|uniref:2-dehydropantoate 2-reductase n=1 Tax=Dendryphion nanum TaxID=256645 RepID=A0A9P9DHG5_9PLEO|nr:ketopantoate reductase PanE/ApbA C terminal-domain-containing protein [Dendryphion nanum]
MATNRKKSVLLIGGGAVGAVAAVNLEAGDLATVTVVLRSSFQLVTENGFTIESSDHGILRGWKPSHVRNRVPDIAQERIAPYDYIILATKNCPDIAPTIADLIRPALPSSNRHTTIVLLQNGLNIEKPIIDAYPNTIVLSGISFIGSVEKEPGSIVQDEPDRLAIGAFTHPNIDVSITEAKAQEFVEIYSKGGKTNCTYSKNVLYDRWRKLVFNACLNPICAITGLDTGRIRLANGAIEGLVRPAMKEIISAALANGVQLADSVVDTMINNDPLDLYLAPSMLADIQKGNYIEYINLLGEPLREGQSAGVAMPTVQTLFYLAQAIQWRTKEARGLVKIPPKRELERK